MICLALASFEAGCRNSDNIQLEATDESVPVLLPAITAGDPQTAVQLLRGFHGVEEKIWRWTMGRFSIALLPPPNPAGRGGVLDIRISVPQAVLDRSKTITLSASVHEIPLKAQQYDAPGKYTFSTDIPPALLGGKAIGVDFAVDPYLPAGLVDARELGVIFLSADLRGK